MKSELTYTILEQEDCNIITFLDTSDYVGEITNPLLKIIPPDLNTFTLTEYNKSSITLIKPEHIKFSTFPSGLYTIIQSICPNELTEVQSYYLHVCNERQCIAELACELDDEETLSTLTDLMFGLQIAQNMANECCEKSVSLWKIIKKKIEQIKRNKNCC